MSIGYCQFYDKTEMLRGELGLVTVPGITPISRISLSSFKPLCCLILAPCKGVIYTYTYDRMRMKRVLQSVTEFILQFLTWKVILVLAVFQEYARESSQISHFM